MAQAERFRAYTTTRTTRRWTNMDPATGETSEVEAEVDASGEVFLGGDVPSSGVVAFDAGKAQIRRVAFYGGAGDDEVCLGSVLVGKPGKISVEASAAK